jgi:hypothetical protein
LSAQRRGGCELSPPLLRTPLFRASMMKLSERSSLPRRGWVGSITLAGFGQPQTGKPWPKVHTISVAGGQIAAQNSASAGEVHWANVTCSLMLLLWVMSPTTFHLTPRRPACRQSARGGEGCVASSWQYAIAEGSKRVGGNGGKFICVSLVVRAVQPGCLAQVWMDHICLRPLAASGFRLTLNEGVEPSLGTPGPE